MKKWRKIACACSLVAVSGGAVFTCATYQFVTETIPDLYAQWAAAEMVIPFRQERERMPADWEELRAYCGPDSPHRGGQSFQEINERIIIDFPDLEKLEPNYPNRPIPEVVHTLSGVQAHWDGAEPNELINRKVRK